MLDNWFGGRPDYQPKESGFVAPGMRRFNYKTEASQRPVSGRGITGVMSFCSLQRLLGLPGQVPGV